MAPVDREIRNQSGRFEGHIFTGPREDVPRPRVELDNRRMSERAAELAGGEDQSGVTIKKSPAAALH